MAVATNSISGNHKIVLKAGYTDGAAEHEEGTLTAAAYPGTNVQMSTAPESLQRFSYTPGSTDAAGTGTVTSQKNPIRILKEDPLVGSTIFTQYAANAPCFIHIAKPGDVLNVLVATGETIVLGDGLSANTSGLWIKDPTNVAVEALEASGGSLAADTWMRARVL